MGIFSKFGTKEKETGLKLTDDVHCYDGRIYDLVTSWLQSEGITLLELKKLFKGYTFPVLLSEFKGYNLPVKCIAFDGRTAEVTFHFGKRQVSIAEKNVMETYSIGNGCQSLQKREIYFDKKKLTSWYSKYECTHILQVDDTHILRVKISEPNKCSEKPVIVVLQNCEEVEEYLLSLDNSLLVNEVYQKIVGIFDFSKEDIKNIETFTISYEELIGEKNRVRQLIDMRCGTMIGYAYMKEDNTYHVCRNGDCEFISSNGIIVGYNIQGKISVKCNRKILASTGLNQLISNVMATFDDFHIRNQNFFS